MRDERNEERIPQVIEFEIKKCEREIITLNRNMYHTICVGTHIHVQCSITFEVLGIV